MKKMKLITTALVALATMLVIENSVQALDFTAGDLILGLRVTPPGNTGTENADNLLVDLGNLSTFTSVSPGGTITLNANTPSSNGLSPTDLASLISGNTTVVWSVFGTDNNTFTIYGTSPNNTFALNSAINQQNVSNNENALYLTGVTSTGNSANSTLLTNVSNSVAGSYTYGIRKSGYTKDWNFANYTHSTENTVGTGNSTSDLYVLTAGANAAGSDLGTFKLNGTSGAFTFTAAGSAAVPEPSTYALMALGGLLILVVRNRRMMNA